MTNSPLCLSSLLHKMEEYFHTKKKKRKFIKINLTKIQYQMYLKLNTWRNTNKKSLCKLRYTTCLINSIKKESFYTRRKLFCSTNVAIIIKMENSLTYTHTLTIREQKKEQVIFLLCAIKWMRQPIDTW